MNKLMSTALLLVEAGFEIRLVNDDSSDVGLKAYLEGNYGKSSGCVYLCERYSSLTLVGRYTETVVSGVEEVIEHLEAHKDYL